MYRMLTSRNTSVWIGLTADVLRALNSRSHEALGGAEPNDVEGNEHLQFALLRANTAINLRATSFGVFPCDGFRPLLPSGELREEADPWLHQVDKDLRETVTTYNK